VREEKGQRAAALGECEKLRDARGTCGKEGFYQTIIISIDLSISISIHLYTNTHTRIYIYRERG